jgi:hypothetical protein
MLSGGASAFCGRGEHPRASSIHEHDSPLCPALVFFAFAWLRASAKIMGSLAPGDQRVDPGQRRPTTAAQAGHRCIPPVLVELLVVLVVLDEVWRRCLSPASSVPAARKGRGWSWPLSSSSRKIHPPILLPVWPMAPWPLGSLHSATEK